MENRSKRRARIVLLLGIVIALVSGVATFVYATANVTPATATDTISLLPTFLVGVFIGRMLAPKN